MNLPCQHTASNLLSQQHQSIWGGGGSGKIFLEKTDIDTLTWGPETQTVEI